MSVYKASGRTILDKESRRRQLVDAAIEVFAAKGYRVASITDIIQQAEVARGTFYLYFRSKEEVFNAALERFHELYQAMTRKEMARNYSNPLGLEGRLREAMREWLGFLLEHRQLTKIVFRQAAAVDPHYERKHAELMRTMQAHWGKAIRFLQHIKLLRADLDPLFLSTVFFGVTTQIALRAIAEKSQPDLDAVVEQWVRLLRGGVLTVKKK